MSGTGKNGQPGKRVAKCVDVLVGVGVCVVAALSLAACTPNPLWWLWVLSQPQAHFLFLAIAAFCWFAWRRRRLWTAFSLCAVILNAWGLVPFFTGTADTMSGAPSLTLVHLNTSQGAADLSNVGLIDADLVFLQEVTPELESSLALHLPRYRIERCEALENTHGSAILIREGRGIRVLGNTLHHLPPTNPRPLISVEVSLDGTLLSLLSLHVIRPRNQGTNADHQVEFGAVAEWSRRQLSEDREVVLIGDFNATPWSARFKDFLADSETHDSMIGRGIQNSWSMFVPQWMGLPIDHAVS